MAKELDATRTLPDSRPPIVVEIAYPRSTHPLDEKVDQEAHDAAIVAVRARIDKALANNQCVKLVGFPPPEAPVSWSIEAVTARKGSVETVQVEWQGIYTFGYHRDTY